MRKHFPQRIRQCQEQIAGYQRDLDGLAAHPLPEKGFVGMTVDGVQHTEKDQAGAALIDFCKKHFTTDPVALGEYRGFSMTLVYDAFHKRFEAALKGAMTYYVELGSDAYGNLQRIENALKDIRQCMETAKVQLDNYEKQIVTAQEEMVKPFPQEEELQAKSARLAELNAELNMDGRSQSREKTEGSDAPEQENEKMEPPSILKRLEQPDPRPAAIGQPRQSPIEVR